jgi:hypothetical protein
MAFRLRWFKIEPFSPGELKRMAKWLLSEKFSHQRGWGFDIAEIRKDYVTGRYIAKEKHIESFRDPRGEVRTVEFEVFWDLEFRIQSANPNLEVLTPSRGLPELFNHFGKSLDYSISITPIAVDPLQWVKHLKKEYDAVSVRRAVISDIELSSSSSASVVIAGSEDVQKYFNKVVPHKSFVLDSAVICFSDLGEDVRFEVNGAGRLKVINHSNKHDVAFFRRHLAALL